jgi:hypothetical protein
MNEYEEYRSRVMRESLNAPRVASLPILGKLRRLGIDIDSSVVDRRVLGNGEQLTIGDY